MLSASLSFVSYIAVQSTLRQSLMADLSVVSEKKDNIAYLH